MLRRLLSPNKENTPPAGQMPTPRTAAEKEKKGVKRKPEKTDSDEDSKSNMYKKAFLELAKFADVPLAVLEELIHTNAKELPETIEVAAHLQQQDFVFPADKNPLVNDLILAKVLSLLTAPADLKNCRLVNQQWRAHASHSISSLPYFITLRSIKRALQYSKLLKETPGGVLHSKFCLTNPFRKKMLDVVNIRIAPRIRELKIVSNASPLKSKTPNHINWSNLLNVIGKMENLQTLHLAGLQFNPGSGNADHVVPAQIHSLENLIINGSYRLPPVDIAAINLDSGTITRVLSIAPNLKAVEINVAGNDVLPQFLEALPQLSRLEFLTLKVPIQESHLAHLFISPTPFALKSLSLSVRLSDGNLLTSLLKAHADTLKSLRLSLSTNRDTQLSPVELPVLTQLEYLQLYTKVDYNHPNIKFPLTRRKYSDEFPALKTLRITLDVLHFYTSAIFPFPKVSDLLLLRSYSNNHVSIEGVTLPITFPKLRAVQIPFPTSLQVKSIIQYGGRYLEELYLGCGITNHINETLTGIPGGEWMVKNFNFQAQADLESLIALNLMRKSSARLGANFGVMQRLKKLELQGIEDVAAWLTLIPAPALEHLTLINSNLSDSCIDALKKKHKMVILRKNTVLPDFSEALRQSHS